MQASDAAGSLPARQVHSYDVFDTLITRLLFQPRHVLELVGMRLKSAGLVPAADAWTTTRMQTELQSRLTREGRETTLDVIYEALARHYGWTSQQKRHALDVELATELEMIRPVGQLQRQLEALRGAGHRCIAVSDTYLGSGEVAALLRKTGLELAADDVFVSCELGASKGFGTLYPILLRRQGLERITLHTGDHPKSDVRRARAAGIPARLVDITAPTRYERMLVSGDETPTGMIGSCLAGASRATRLAADCAPEHQVFWDTGANVMGPLLVSYLLDVLEDAQRRQLERLYFVARDGWIMMRMAEILLPWFGRPMQLRYLHGSRTAWHQASIDASTLLQPPSWLTENLPATSLRAFLERLGISPEDSVAPCEAVGLSLAASDEPLGSGGVRLVERLLSHASFQKLVLEKAERSRLLAADYLQAQGLCDDLSWALVDIGWQGRIQSSLRQLLPASAAARLRGYYLGLSRRAQLRPPGEMWAYLPQSLAPHSVALHAHRTLAELMCAAPHGTTLGYARAPAGVEPVLAEDPTSQDPRLETQRAAMMLFTAEFVRAATSTDLPADVVGRRLRSPARGNWASFVHQPSLAEAAAYGSLVHHHEQGHGRDTAFEHLVAPRLSARALLRGVASSPATLARSTWWGEASAARSLRPPLARTLQLLYRLRGTAMQAASIWRSR